MYIYRAHIEPFRKAFVQLSAGFAAYPCVETAKALLSGLSSNLACVKSVKSALVTGSD